MEMDQSDDDEVNDHEKETDRNSNSSNISTTNCAKDYVDIGLNVDLTPAKATISTDTEDLVSLN
jgi:hypothetical protein